MSIIRNAITTLLGILVLSTIFLLLLELTARVFIFGWAGLDPARINSVKPMIRTGFIQPSTKPGIIYELRPNIRDYFKLVEFDTSQDGLRDRKYALDKPDDTFRVVVVGASFSMASGVRIEDTYHSVLESRLSSRGAPYQYEFINFSVGGYFPSQQLGTLQHRAMAYQPDLIVFPLTKRNIDYFPESRVSRSLSFKRRSVTQPFYDSFLMKYLEALKEQREHPGRVEANRPPPIPFPNRDEGDNQENVLQALGALQQDSGIPIVIIYLDFNWLGNLSDLGLIREAAEHQGLHWIDTRKAFADKNSAQLWINRLDPHPNAEAHRIFAQVLEDYLRINKLLNLGMSIE